MLLQNGSRSQRPFQTMSRLSLYHFAKGPYRMVMIVGKRFQISLHLVRRAVLVDYLQFGAGKLAALWFHAAIINK